MEEDIDTVNLVEKLKKKLSDATSEPTMGNQEDIISKLLKKLSVFPMTLEILQVTQIGRHVNKLRKWKGGKVSSRAKALVKHWKQLLPASESEEASTSMDSVSGPELSGSERLEMDRAPESGSHRHHGSRGLDHQMQATPVHHHGSRGLDHHMQATSAHHHGSRGFDHHMQATSAHHHHGSDHQMQGTSVHHHGSRGLDRHMQATSVPIITVESGGDSSEASVIEIPPPEHHGHHHHKDKGKKKKKRKRTEREDGEREESFRSFEMSLDPGSFGVSSKKRAQHRTKVSEEDVLVVATSTPARKKRRSQSPAVLPVGGAREKSPGVLPVVGSRAMLPTPRDGTTTSSAVKQKEVEPQVTIAQSKRSRTQVYSGKKAQSGPQVVSSLFDMCMKILIDSIDMIEEVGAGVPYHVLEPLLQRCSATQLMKLEEFNPHLIEDTEGLWRKHVVKDFKVVKLPAEYTWRELYREQVAEREERLRNLTARIKANNHAREEPVRKVELVVPTLKPGRRSGIKRGGFSRPMERPHSGSQLMKRTMKMAQERNHMVAFKRGKR